MSVIHVLHIMYCSIPLNLPAFPEPRRALGSQHDSAELSLHSSLVQQIDALRVKGLPQSWNMLQSEDKAPTEKYHHLTMTSYNKVGKLSSPYVAQYPPGSILDICLQSIYNWVTLSVGLFCTHDIYCMSFRPGKGIPHLFLRFLHCFPVIVFPLSYAVQFVKPLEENL